MSLWQVEMAAQAVAFFDNLGQGSDAAEVRGIGFMAAGLSLAGIGLGLTIAPILTAVVNAVGDQERAVASSLVIILRLIGMSISMSSMTAWTPAHDGPEPAADRSGGRSGSGEDGPGCARRRDEDLERDRLISLAVAVVALGVAFLLQRGDVVPTR